MLRLSSTQWRAGWSGAYGLDLGVVRGIARDFGIRRDESFYRKVKAFENEVLDIWRSKKRRGGTRRESDEEYLASIEEMKKRYA